MSKAALLSYDTQSRRKTIYHEQDGKTFVEMRQDFGPALKLASMLAEEPPSKEDGWRFLGMIPFDQAVLEGWVHDEKKIRAFLNDRDNRAWNGGRERVG